MIQGLKDVLIGMKVGGTLDISLVPESRQPAEPQRVLSAVNLENSKMQFCYIFSS